MTQLPVIQAQCQAYELENRPNIILDNAAPSLLKADNDLDAIHEYLITKCKKTTTYKAMISAIRKLLVFMQLHEELFALADWKLLHCSQFQDWLVDKDGVLTKDADQLIYDKTVGGSPVFWLKHENRANPDWRPFKKPMNEVTAQQTINRVATLFQWLNDAQYLAIGNPWKIADKVSYNKRLTDIGTGEHKTKIERALDWDVIQAIMDYLKNGMFFKDDASMLEPDAPVLKELVVSTFARRRWIFYFYFYTAARVSSGLTATLDDLYLDPATGHPMLRLIVKGRGTKTHAVPWISELDGEYHQYRRSLDLPADAVKPALNPPALDRELRHELGPRHLLLPLRLRGYRLNPKPRSYNNIHSEIKELFLYAHRWAVRHPRLGLDERQLLQLSQASGHWVRHGTASLLGDYAQEQLGHEHKTTTNDYQVAQRKAQIGRLNRIGDEAVDEEIFYQLLEADDETKRRWIAVLEDSISTK